MGMQNLVTKPALEKSFIFTGRAILCIFLVVLPRSDYPFLSLQNILPCSKCSENYKQNLKDYPIDPALENRDSLIKWAIDVHNSVNRETDKSELDYDKAIQLYLQDQTPYLDYCFKIAILLCLLYFVYHYLKKN